METPRQLNIDLGDSISSLRYFLQSFQVRTKLYNIFFKGKSFNFEGFRDYDTNEDVSSVDWKASARSGKMLVRQYKDELQKKILFIVDVGENMVFGSAPKLKCEYAAEIVLSLTDLVLKMNDKAGLIIFNDNVVRFISPQRGKRTFDEFYYVLSNPQTYKGGSNLTKALDFALQNCDKTLSAVVVVSDFINFDKKTKHAMEIFSDRYETMALIVKDPLDKTLPDMSGEFILQNPMNGDQLLVEPKIARKSYETQAKKKDIF